MLPSCYWSWLVRSMYPSFALKSMLQGFILPGFEWKMTRVIKLISKARGNPHAGLTGPVYYTSSIALSARGYHGCCDRHNCFHVEILRDRARQVIETVIFLLTRTCQSSELVDVGLWLHPELVLKARLDWSRLLQPPGCLSSSSIPAPR